MSSDDSNVNPTDVPELEQEQNSPQIDPNAQAPEPEVEFVAIDDGFRDERQVKESYNSEDIIGLSDLEHVRLRPSMYIGDVASQGLHHLVNEVVDNSLDE
ncbi:MAG: DNA gyrase subunit B, partial [Thermoguttaceae bacterium]|nr:DNA gyrase subunit B [Thermoguttaceae bacterium]